MPREFKKRGRRLDNKRKHDGSSQRDRSPKRYRSDEVNYDEDDVEIRVDGDAGDDFIGIGSKPEIEDEQHFYGLLDVEEQEYYSKVNEKIKTNDFESDEERTVFVEAVYRESQGKEIKLASSQSCSRHLERIIMLSTSEQLRALFSTFLGHMTYLVQHRFGSHCCEMLFLESAKKITRKSSNVAGQEEKSQSLEDLFLAAAKELEPNIGHLFTDRHASHAIRALFLVLSPESLDQDLGALLASKKKEKVERPVQAEENTGAVNRIVPKSFKNALNQLVGAAVLSLDTTYLRALATHPTGNPVLQLLLRLELTNPEKNKQLDEQTVFGRLFPDKSLDPETESAKFISSLLYDSTGSHLIEVLVQYVPGKIFKNLYKNVLKSRIASMSKNDIAMYIAIKILERVSKDDLTDIRDQILPEIPTLVERHRTAILKVLISRCQVRGVDLRSVADIVRSAYGDDGSSLLIKMLNIPQISDNVDTKVVKEHAEATKPQRSSTSSDLHGSLLAQEMLRVPAMRSLIQESMLALEKSILVRIGKDPIATRVLQAAISPEPATLQFRRQIIPSLYGNMTTLALHPAGSHLADALWAGTEGLHFMKERLASELASNESQLRESPSGRLVWKNWSMDLYQRQRREWQALAKGFQDNVDEGTSAGKKSNIQLARERFAQQRQEKNKYEQNEKHQTSPSVRANA